jgi:FixJ family two-component response regulator
MHSGAGLAYKMNILPPVVIAVVDDDESVRMAAASLLRSCGWIVRTYACGKDLLAVVDRENNIRLIIADIQMPEMDGFELEGKLARRAAHVPVIFTTAYATPDVVNRVAGTGAVDFFPKPLDDARFLARVSEIVASGFPG